MTMIEIIVIAVLFMAAVVLARIEAYNSGYVLGYKDGELSGEENIWKELAREK